MPVRSRLQRGATVGCFGILGLCASANAASVSWTAPAVCPGQAEVIERIETARGGPLAEAPALDFAAEVSAATDGRLTLTVRNGSAQGRTLSASDCEELVTALGQIVSLALGPHVPQERTEPAVEVAEGEPEVLEQRSSVPATVPFFDSADDSAKDVAPLRRPDTDRTRALLGLLGVFDGATLGTASLGVQLEAGMRLGSVFELRTVVGYTPTQTINRADESAGGFSLALGGVLACAVWRESPWRAPLCAGMEGGRLSASGLGVEEPVAKHLLWLAARADARLGVELTAGLRANLLAGLVVPLMRHEFSVAGTPLHELPALSPRAGLGLEHAF